MVQHTIGCNKRTKTEHISQKRRWKRWHQSGSRNDYNAYAIVKHAGKNDVNWPKRNYKMNSMTNLTMTTTTVPILLALTSAAATQDISHFRQLKNKFGKLSVTNSEIPGQWQKYFEEISALELYYPLVPIAPPTHVSVPSITCKKAATAFTETKNQ